MTRVPIAVINRSWFQTVALSGLLGVRGGALEWLRFGVVFQRRPA
jgi:hypothetical protein